MSIPLTPCPCCGRHLAASAKDCAFCRRRFVLKAGLAAAALVLVPEAARGQEDPVPPYGVPPIPSPLEEAVIEWFWTDTVATWRASLGFAKPYASWKRLGKGAIATYSCEDRRKDRETTVAVTIHFALELKEGIQLRLSGPSRPLPGAQMLAGDGAIPEEAQVVKEAREELKVGDTTFACTAKSYEWVGNELKVWWCADAPGGFVKAERGKDRVELKVVEEKVEAVQRTWACSVWEAAREDGRMREWRHDDAPSGLVKWEHVDKDGKVLRTAVLSQLDKR